MAINVLLTLPYVEILASKGLTGIYGTVDVFLPPIELTVATWYKHGTVDIALPAIQLDAHMTSTSFSADIFLPAIELDGSISLSSFSASLSLPSVTVYARLGRAYNMSLTKTLPSITLSAYLAITPSITADITLPTIIVDARISPTVSYLVVNPVNSSVTEYSLSPQSIATKGNTVYISDGSKIYTLSGDDDDGTDIDSTIQLGLSDANTNLLKRVTDALMGLRSDGEMQITLLDDENLNTNNRTVPSTSDKIKMVRAKMPKGNKCTYYSLKIVNVDGSDFEIAKIIVLGNTLSRRYHA